MEETSLESFNGEGRKKARKEKNTTKKEKTLLLNKGEGLNDRLLDSIIRFRSSMVREIHDFLARSLFWSIISQSVFQADVHRGHFA